MLCDLREKEKLKEREEAWIKLHELARKNPVVSLLWQILHLVDCLFLWKRQSCD